jgi:hypothetical protein
MQMTNTTILMRFTAAVGRRVRVWGRALALASAGVCAMTVQAQPAVAFFYGANPPWESLQAFDLVVVDPDHVSRPAHVGLPHTELAAYVSVGEVHPSRPYAGKLPAHWLRGDNVAWRSRLLDQAQPEWPGFFVNEVISPLWLAGYRSFFLDTLDSYHLFARTPAERSQQEAGLVAVIRAIKQRYPSARLIFNRGFEILDQTHDAVAMLAAESLYKRYDASRQAYGDVPPDDRAWLHDKLTQAKRRYGMPVIAIDYVPAAEREQARETARRIKADGFIPWVATHDLASLGIGAIEVMPRKVLMVLSARTDQYALSVSEPVRHGTLPLQYLGYTVEYANHQTLPEGVLSGRYAGVVVWLEGRTEPGEYKAVADWLVRPLDERVPVVFINDVGPMLKPVLQRRLAVRQGPDDNASRSVRIERQSPLLGHEYRPRPHPSEFVPLEADATEPLLVLSKGRARQVAAALTSWGGYVMYPYAVITLSSTEQERWVIDPMAFLRQALRLPDLPVPDVTTETGRRMLLIHMDGDAFISRSELPGAPYAGELLRDRVVKRYALPMTLSVIEAELSPQGLYPQLSARMEAVARDIFRAPHVEIASHSYSHPFVWYKLKRNPSADDYNLDIPGYVFDLKREIEGSKSYIETRLAPPGKRVELFLWTGDTNPGREGLALVRQAGMLSMNGGDTMATRSRATLTSVAPYGIQVGDQFQVFAPNQNENVYTNNWTGPFYGYERVLETFEFTEQPRRLKPVNIYFHTYILTKRAGLQSLEKVFDWALAAELTPVRASSYARKVEAFQRFAVARTDQGWRLRGNGELRTVRSPSALGMPDLTRSQGVAGYAFHQDSVYTHLTASSVDLVLAPGVRAVPRLVSANAAVQSAGPTERGYRWQLAGEVPLSFTLAEAADCRVMGDGQALRPTRGRDGHYHYRLSHHAAGSIEAICRH